MDSESGPDGLHDLPEQAACLHHWVIDRPAGPTSMGQCQGCGERREFHNFVEGSSWRSEALLDQPSGGSQLPSVDLTAAIEETASDE